MIAFIVSVFAMWSLCLGAGEGMDWLTTTWYSPSATTWMMLVFPTVAAWGVAEASEGWSPRKLFDGRTGSLAARSRLGLGVGALGVLFAVLSLPVLDALMADWAVLTLASGFAAGILLGVQARVRRGQCVYCDYDLRALPALQCCPECGKTDVL